jgi:hypothetical protein
MGEGRGVYRVLVGRPEGKRQLGRPRRRWKDNIKLDLQSMFFSQRKRKFHTQIKQIKLEYSIF